MTFAEKPTHSLTAQETAQYAMRAAKCVAGFGLTLAAGAILRDSLQGDSRALFSWLLGFSVWFSVALGMLMLTMLFYVFGAGWPILIRRQLEHCLHTFPYLAGVLAPLVILAWVYPEYAAKLWKWMNPDALLASGGTVGTDPLYHSKKAYLNLPFFTARVALYFAVFCTLAHWLRRASFQVDRGGGLQWVHCAERCSALGIPLVALCLTFAAFDLFMSISYHWFSTMYGVWFFATSMRAGIAVTLLLCSYLAIKPGRPLHGLFNSRHTYQLGCLSLAFTVFWAYISFCQYFLIYNANIPEETFWYNMRELLPDGTLSSWWHVSLWGLIGGYFVVPFLALLFYNTKVVRWRIVAISLWIMAFHAVDLYFNLLPHQIPSDNPLGYTVPPFSITLSDVAAIVGTGALCAYAYLKSFSSQSIVPHRDPYILESIQAHG